ncbi:MAG: hypothetical protein SNG69_07200 [Rikenellaceae bacterium]
MAKKKVVTEEVVSTEVTPIEENQETKVVTEEVVSTEAAAGEEAQTSQEEEQEPKGEDQASKESESVIVDEKDIIAAKEIVVEEDVILSEEGERLKELYQRYGADPLVAALNHIEDAEAALQEVIKQRKAKKKPTVSFSRCKKVLSDTKKRLSAYVKN